MKRTLIFSSALLLLESLNARCILHLGIEDMATIQKSYEIGLYSHIKRNSGEAHQRKHKNTLSDITNTTHFNQKSSSSSKRNKNSKNNVNTT